jgi:hypothetical protein
VPEPEGSKRLLAEGWRKSRDEAGEYKELGREALLEGWLALVLDVEHRLLVEGWSRSSMPLEWRLGMAGWSVFWEESCNFRMKYLCSWVVLGEVLDAMTWPILIHLGCAKGQLQIEESVVLKWVRTR